MTFIARFYAALLLFLIPVKAESQRKNVLLNEPQSIRAAEDGSYLLAAPKAEIYGEDEAGKIAIYDQEMCIGWWNSPGDHVIWTVEAAETGPFDVWLHWSIADEWAGNWFYIENGPSRCLGNIPKTGGFTHFKMTKFGQLQLFKGLNKVVMRPVAGVNGELADLKAVILKPKNDAIPSFPEGGMAPEQTAKTLRAPDGFDLSLFASEPLISNPTSIVVDHRNRVWITEATVYRNPEKPMDRIKVLEDSDGDGQADRVTVFAEGLLAPMSLLVAGSKVFVAESPHLLVFEDKDGDLKADGPAKRLLTGFGGYNDDQALHGFAFGPDHRLWMTQGDLASDVTGPDGSKFKHDVGALLRCEFSGNGLETIVWDLKNPIEVALNSFGEAWFSGNDDDGTRMCRLDYALQGGFYGWRYWGVYGERRQVYGSGPDAHWHANHFGVVPPALITGFGSPCGKFFVEDGQFGAEYQGALFHVDPGPRQVRVYHINSRSATPTVRTEIFLSNETDSYFRPIDGAFSPDGFLYLCDWYDQGVGGHAYNDPNRGRIYRIQRKGVSIPSVDPLTNPFAALANPNLEMQFQARERILGMGVQAIPELLSRLDRASDSISARMLWILGRLGGQGIGRVKNELKNKHPDRRALALRILRSFRHFDESQYNLIHDPSPVVRRELLLNLQHISSSRAEDTIAELARQWDGEDRFYLEAIGIAARGPLDRNKERFTDFRKSYETMRIDNPSRLRRLFETLVAGKETPVSPRTVALALLLQPKSGHQYWLSRMKQEKLSPAAQAAIVSSLSPVADDEMALKVIGILQDPKEPDDLKEIALSALRRNIRGAWSNVKSSPEFMQAIGSSLKSPRLRREAFNIIEEARLTWAAADVLKFLQDPIEASRALRVLASLREKSVAPEILNLLEKTDSDTLREIAAETLVEIFDPEITHKLLSSDQLPVQSRESALRRLLQKSPGAVWVVSLLEQNAFPTDLRSQAVAMGAAHVDISVRALFQKFIPEAQRPTTLGQTVSRQQILAMTGDPDRGRNVFFNGAAGCAQCHRVQGRGNAVGPDLSMIGKKFAKDGLLESILNPSSAISPDYSTSIVETRDGEVYAGFLKPAGKEQWTLRTIANELVTFEKSQIEKIVAQKTSLMPEQLADLMTTQDLADLLAFLSGLDKETQLVPGWWVLGVFPNDNEKGFHTDFGPEKTPAEINLGAEYKGIGNRTIRWEFVPTLQFQDSQGFDLQGFVSQRNFRTGDLVTYLCTAIESPADQTVGLLLGSEDAVKIWLNGKLVHENFVRRSPPMLGQDLLQLSLQKGRNLVMVKLEQIGGGGGVIAALQSREPVAFIKP